MQKSYVKYLLTEPNSIPKIFIMTSSPLNCQDGSTSENMCNSVHINRMKKSFDIFDGAFGEKKLVVYD